MKTLQQKANSFARKCGYGIATEIIITDDNEPTVVRRTSYGYRKYTTGEYVSNRYRQCFGWKNTYWQHAETVIGIPKNWI